MTLNRVDGKSFMVVMEIIYHSNSIEIPEAKLKLLCKKAMPCVTDKALMMNSVP